MEHFVGSDLEHRRRFIDEPWLEFYRSSSLSTGIYTLPMGGVDEQVPHNEDEIYVVVTGSATLVTPTRSATVRPGDVVFVPAREEHRFVDITDELRVVVIFAPPETEPTTS